MHEPTTEVSRKIECVEDKPSIHIEFKKNNKTIAKEFIKNDLNCEMFKEMFESHEWETEKYLSIEIDHYHYNVFKMIQNKEIVVKCNAFNEEYTENTISIKNIKFPKTLAKSMCGIFEYTILKGRIDDKFIKNWVDAKNRIYRSLCYFGNDKMINILLHYSINDLMFIYGINFFREKPMLPDDDIYPHIFARWIDWHKHKYFDFDNSIKKRVLSNIANINLLMHQSDFKPSHNLFSNLYPKIHIDSFYSILIRSDLKNIICNKRKKKEIRYDVVIICVIFAILFIVYLLSKN